MRRLNRGDAFQTMSRSGMPFVVIFVLTLITGCWDSTEINDLAIVIASAVDSSKGKTLSLTEQIAVPGQMASAAGGGGGGGGQQQYYTATGVGRDLGEAHASLQRKVSRELFMSHRRIILFGESAAKKGILPYLDEPARNPQSRMRTNVAITRGEARRYLTVNYPFESVTGEAIRKLLYGPMQSYKVDLRRLDETFASEVPDLMIPVVQLVPNVPGSKPRFDLDGAAVMHAGRWIDELTPDQAQDVLWILQDHVDNLSVPITGSGRINLEMHQSITQVRTNIVHGQVRFTVHVRPTFDLVEDDSNLNPAVSTDIERMNRTASQYLQKRLVSTTKRLQRDRADVLGFGKLVHHAHPREWKQLRTHWDDAFARSLIQVDVTVRIKREGMDGPRVTHIREKPAQREGGL